MRRFNGEINGKKLTDFGLDKLENVETYKERTEMVEDLLGDSDFFTTYFNEYYKASANKDDYLAEDDSVCKRLEIMATYLLSASDIESNRKVEYRFWKDEREFNDYQESETKATLNKKVDDGEGNNVEVIDMFVDKKNDENQKIVEPISVTTKDKKAIKEIGGLEDAIEYLKSHRGQKAIKDKTSLLLSEGCLGEIDKQRVKYIAKNANRYVARTVKDLRANQLDIKKAVTRPIEFKNVLPDEGVPNKLDVIDFMEKKDVRLLLSYLGREDLMDEFGIMIYDLNVLINKAGLSKREMEIVELYRAEYKQNEIAEELGIDTANVRTYENRIAVKVAKVYEKQIENYRQLKRAKKV